MRPVWLRPCVPSPHPCVSSPPLCVSNPQPCVSSPHPCVSRRCCSRLSRAGCDASSQTRRRRLTTYGYHLTAYGHRLTTYGYHLIKYVYCPGARRLRGAAGGEPASLPGRHGDRAPPPPRVRGVQPLASVPIRSHPFTPVYIVSHRLASSHPSRAHTHSHTPSHTHTPHTCRSPSHTSHILTPSSLLTLQVRIRRAGYPIKCGFGQIVMDFQELHIPGTCACPCTDHPPMPAHVSAHTRHACALPPTGLAAQPVCHPAWPLHALPCRTRLVDRRHRRA